MLQYVLSKRSLKPATQRALVGEVQQRYGASQRQICTAFRFNRKSVQYWPKKNAANDALLGRIKERAMARVRYGQHRIWVSLRREGWLVNQKRVSRLYRKEGLSLRAKAPEGRRTCNLRQVRLAPSGPNEIWCMDFMHERLTDDPRKASRILTVVDVFTRECLALEVATGFRARRVVEVLAGIVARRGAPKAARCDQGTEFTAEALDQWAYNNRIELDFSRPGKPTDNAFIESFTSSVRRDFSILLGLIP